MHVDGCDVRMHRLSTFWALIPLKKSLSASPSISLPNVFMLLYSRAQIHALISVLVPLTILSLSCSADVNTTSVKFLPSFFFLLGFFALRKTNPILGSAAVFLFFTVQREKRDYSVNFRRSRTVDVFKASAHFASTVNFL